MASPAPAAPSPSRARTRDERRDVRMVPDVLVPVGHHGAAPVPAAVAEGIIAKFDGKSDDNL